MNTAKRTAAHTALDAHLDDLNRGSLLSAGRDPVNRAIDDAENEARANFEAGKTAKTGALTAISNTKVVDFVPARPCRDTLYAPFYFRDPDTGREFIYSMGGRIDNVAFDDGTPTPPKFVDKIFVSVRLDDGAEVPPPADGGSFTRLLGTWSAPKLCIGPDTFPWMKNYLAERANHPPWYVASASSPSVFKLEGTFYMLFTASINDSNLATGEHNSPESRDPWSHFVVYLATSDDGIKWTLASTGRGHENPAIAAAQLWHVPTAADIAAGAYKGIAAVSALEADGFIYVMMGCWMNAGQKNGLVRTKVGGDAWEILTVGTPKQDHPMKWEALVNGELPLWFVQGPWNWGNPYPLIVNGIAKTTLPPTRFIDPAAAGDSPAPLQFVLTYEAPGFQFGKRPDSAGNCIGIAASHSLDDWPFDARMIGGDIKTIDGFGTNFIVKNPVYYERDGKAFILFATSDHDWDGKPDCPGDLGGYIGLAIHELELA